MLCPAAVVGAAHCSCRWQSPAWPVARWKAGVLDMQLRRCISIDWRACSRLLPPWQLGSFHLSGAWVTVHRPGHTVFELAGNGVSFRLGWWWMGKSSSSTTCDTIIVVQADQRFSQAALSWDRLQHACCICLCVCKQPTANVGRL